MKNLICAVAVLAVSTAQAEVIYVDASCPGGDGSVGDPYCSIQAAIESAVNTDEIIVAPGTYFETIDLLGKAVWLHSSDGPDITTIDAQANGTVISCTSGEGIETVVEGFTITGGTGTNLPSPFAGFSGGGMLNVSSSPTVTACIFVTNTADNRGGGMCNIASSPTVTNCVVTGNSTAVFGGGIYNGGVDGVDSNPVLTGCTLDGNIAGTSGGGMYNTGADISVSNPILVDCTFSANLATGRGGGLYNNGGTQDLSDCSFVGNLAGVNGGGIYNLSASGTLNNCVFRDNEAVENGGGLMNANYSDPVVSQCEFDSNTAGDRGGGIWNGSLSSPVVTGCDLRGNEAPVGAGMFANVGPGDIYLADSFFCENVLENIWGEWTDGGGNLFQDVCCTGDLNSDGMVGIGDFLILLAFWGRCDAVCLGDLDGDGFVGISDFLLLLASWGPCP